MTCLGIVKIAQCLSPETWPSTDIFTTSRYFPYPNIHRQVLTSEMYIVFHYIVHVYENIELHHNSE